MTDSEWLLFLAQLPATPSSLRVNIWRRLRDAGSISLQNGVWVLPFDAENKIFMERLLAYTRQNKASGQIFNVQSLNQSIREDIVKRFNDERDQEYSEFLEQCTMMSVELEKECINQKFTFAELEENEQNYERLLDWLTKIQKRDFFKAEKLHEALAALRSCQQKLHDYTQQVYESEGIEIPPTAVLPPKTDHQDDLGTENPHEP